MKSTKKRSSTSDSPEQDTSTAKKACSEPSSPDKALSGLLETATNDLETAMGVSKEVARILRSWDNRTAEFNSRLTAAQQLDAITPNDTPLITVGGPANPGSNGSR